MFSYYLNVYFKISFRNSLNWEKDYGFPNMMLKLKILTIYFIQFKEIVKHDDRIIKNVYFCPSDCKNIFIIFNENPFPSANRYTLTQLCCHIIFGIQNFLFFPFCFFFFFVIIKEYFWIIPEFFVCFYSYTLFIFFFFCIFVAGPTCQKEWWYWTGCRSVPRLCAAPWFRECHSYCHAV